MPFPNLNIIKYLPKEDEGRNCPVCGHQLFFLDDGITKLFKCLNCGYARKTESGISDQKRYDLPVVLVGMQKKAYYELFQPIDEKLYNILIDFDWLPEEAINAVIKDLDLNDSEAKYFLEKLNFLNEE